MQDPRSNQGGGVAQSGCLFGGLLLGLGLSGVLLWFAILREMQHFWRNDGGYPVELRELVEVSFYPLAIAALVGLSLLGWALFRRSPRRTTATIWIVQVLLLGLCLMLVIAAGAVAFTNNVVNLWNGAPLHSHPAEKPSEG